jgi:hypothetical protein
MTSSGLVWRLGTICILAMALAAFSPKAAFSQSADSGSSGAGLESAHPGAAASSDTGSAAKSDSSDDSDSDSAPGAYAIHTALKSVNTSPRTGDGNFDLASDLFPAFCKDWQRRLHDRELNNLENITWKDENGWKTGTYVSYSPVKTCNCKRSTGGVPIGELTYQETELYLAGHTVEEARHAQPKSVGITNTTEIFRWDRTKWDDGR